MYIVTYMYMFIIIIFYFNCFCRYPAVLDTVLVQERGGDRRKLVEKFVSLFLTGTRHEVKV